MALLRDVEVAHFGTDANVGAGPLPLPTPTLGLYYAEATASLVNELAGTAPKDAPML